MDAEFRSEDERDRALLRSFHDGDVAAFGELYSWHRRRVLRLAWRLTRDWHLAEDIAQETFVKALSAASRLTEDSRFWPWLRVIAWRTSIDALRLRGKVQPATHIDPGALAAPADAGLIAQEDADLLQLAFSRVRPRHARVLTWQAQGATYDEIAQRLGVPVATVTSLLHRARQALRREYLALTGPDHLPAILSPALLATSGTLRRLRDRLHQLTTQLPNATAVSGSVAAVVLGVGSLLTPHIPHAVTPAPPPRVLVGGGDARLHRTVDVTEGATRMPADRRPLAHPDQPRRRRGDITSATRYRPDITFDQRERERRRREDAHMPYTIEVGPTWWGADPGQMQRDLEASMEGDFGWLEG